MHTHADKVQENKLQAAAGVVSRQQGKGGARPVFQLADNRASTTAQKKLLEGLHSQSRAKMAPQPAALTNVAQAKHTLPLQENEGDEVIQAKSAPVDKGENKTGLPDKLKQGIEGLSGYAMDDVQVHYNSGKPAQLQAHAYAQATGIYLATGQEKHLPHEAWHVVQQKQGRVKPTLQLKNNIPVNDNAALENEADVMGARALQQKAEHAEDHTPAAVAVRAPAVAGKRAAPAAQMNTAQRITYTQEDVKVQYNGESLEVTRTNAVEGDIQVTGTADRGAAPDPLPYTQVEQKMGLEAGSLIKYTGYDKGHIMALQLGGEDTAKNIVPQWGNWQRTGDWRKNEVAAKKGKKYKVEVEYAGRRTGIKPLMPTNFNVTIDGKPSALENEPDQGDLNETPKEEARYEFEQMILKQLSVDEAAGEDLLSKGYSAKMVQKILQEYPGYRKPNTKKLAEARAAARQAETDLSLGSGSLDEYFIGEAGLTGGIKGSKAKAVARAEKIYGQLLARLKADDTEMD